LLRCQSYEPELQSLCDWWTEFQSVSDKQKKIMCQELHQARQGRKPARSKKKKKPVVQKRHDIDPEPNSNV
jgi:hypothetical protein